MALFELSRDRIRALQNVEFKDIGILERSDLQRLLRDYIDVLSPDTLVIQEEFSYWDRSERRIDLLGIDKQGRLVVIELKRTTNDAFADLQALRYAAMASRMTFEEAVETYRAYLIGRQRDGDPETMLLEFLGWTSPSDGRFGEDVRIVLGAAGFSPELTSTVLWLNERDIDIICIRLQPYEFSGSILLDVQQIIPLPEAEDYQIKIRQKQREVRTASEQSSDRTKYDVTVGDQAHKRQSKRMAMYLVCRYLIGKGVLPADIGRTANRSLFEVVEGNVDATLFREELRRKHPNDANYASRYYCDDDQLFRCEGSTYALSNQWTGVSMEETMVALLEKYPAYGISYQPAED